MSEQSEIVAAIRAHPEDAAYRLVYADWLEEHGEAERARAIRILSDDRYLPPEDEMWVSEGAWRLVTRRQTMNNRVRWSVFHDKENSRILVKPKYFKAVISVLCRDLIPVGCAYATMEHGLVFEAHGHSDSIFPIIDRLIETDPVKKITLTNRLSIEGNGLKGEYRLRGRSKYYHGDAFRLADDLAPVLLRSEWPQVEWVLPPIGSEAWGTGSRSPRDDLRQIQEAMNVGLRIPEESARRVLGLPKLTD
jgi:uncharacterized protein (TIGR02996 family)